MDIQSRKIEFVQEFLKLQSEEVISRLEKLLKKETAKTRDLKPFTMEELNARLDKSEEDFRNGRYISSEDLLKEIKGWK
ncbi:hypothetical protein [Flavobacterium subsaxonicum]|uniref:Addiction module protein n=1 Tax=Flavobacterium subsaxonicum WB 4.1-42 = DSM 21790 TaxID=1121898 RepID=A0A0A2MND2_9FLAO|nr:hypothetical protein [Flavobacterium subsaxonicum]KGO93076.1 hypothetical protein Q766_10715 [Flavobacterium subsaxonicum WB 4.1-42 = DSM 21790]